MVHQELRCLPAPRGCPCPTAPSSPSPTPYVAAVTVSARAGVAWPSATLAHLREGETHADLAIGFGIGTITAFRCIREVVDALAALACTLPEAMTSIARKAFVIVDGTLLRMDRVGMSAGRDRPYCSGKHQRHGMNVQVIADPAGRLIWAWPTLPGARRPWSHLRH